jgi:hypothetical protein
VPGLGFDDLVTLVPPEVAARALQVTVTKADSEECKRCAPVGVQAQEMCAKVQGDLEIEGIDCTAAGSDKFGTEAYNWRWSVYDQCLQLCDWGVTPDCGDLGIVLQNQCVTLVEVLLDPVSTRQECEALQFGFQKNCEAEVGDVSKLCVPSQDLFDCQRRCGNYRDCSCSLISGRFTNECFGHMLNPLTTQSCNDMNPDHHKTFHHVQDLCGPGMPCAKYYDCPMNMCALLDTQCFPEQECVFAGTCDNTTGSCVYELKAPGTPCDDLKSTTFDDQCVWHSGDDGVTVWHAECEGKKDLCQWYGIECTPPNPCMHNGTCDRSNGDCIFTPYPDGVMCDDGNIYTENDVCTAGTCSGTPFDICAECRDDDGPRTSSDECLRSRCDEVLGCVWDSLDSPLYSCSTNDKGGDDSHFVLRAGAWRRAKTQSIRKLVVVFQWTKKIANFLDTHVM